MCAIALNPYEIMLKSQNSSPKFSQKFRQQVGKQTTPLLGQFEELALSLAGRSPEEVIWQPPENLQELLDHYLDTLSIVYLKKYSVFSQCLIQVLNEENYLLYGLIGRAIIEHTAVLRYQEQLIQLQSLKFGEILRLKP